MAIVFFRLQLQLRPQRHLLNLQLVHGQFLHRFLQLMFWLLAAEAEAECRTVQHHQAVAVAVAEL
jgi:hypothetical protein